jgi:hypothetical protein
MLRPTVGVSLSRRGRPPFTSVEVGVAARQEQRTSSRPGISPRPVGLRAWSFTPLNRARREGPQTEVTGRIESRYTLPRSVSQKKTKGNEEIQMIPNRFAST